jgi:hypothetical protein
MQRGKSVAVKAGPFSLVADPIPPYKGTFPDRNYNKRVRVDTHQQGPGKRRGKPLNQPLFS